ncbi:hypothetical protein BKA56DRAFT_663439 [Ilyonectria sp. MPI-CAGE-AT-0026]|nr:hypothetical protein BKA56DRAFT_663439 [Ilyonectria sp. MPI-CAGE-AT-0026]
MPCGSRSGKGRKGGKGTSGTAPAPNDAPAPNGGGSASNDSGCAYLELPDFQPWVPPNHPSWTPPDTRVYGHRLPNVELEDDQPDETVLKLLIRPPDVFKNVSAAVRTLAQNYFKIKRIIGVRTRPGADGTTYCNNLNLKRGANCDAAFYHLYSNLRSGTDACGPCQRGFGPFDSCVQINGACANCCYNSAAKRCTLYVKDGDAKLRGKKRSRKRKALDDNFSRRLTLH